MAGAGVRARQAVAWPDRIDLCELEGARRVVTRQLPLAQRLFRVHAARWLLLVSIGIAPLGAQAQRPVFRSAVDVVMVEATVVDRAGDAARGLKPSDFRVEIGGRPREVLEADFVEYDTAGTAAAKPDAAISSNANESNRRNVLIVVDQSSLRFENRGVLEGAKRWVLTLGPQDRVGFVGLPSPGPVVDFTLDRARVLAAFGELKAGVGRPMPPYSTRNVSLWEAFQIVEHNDQVRAEVIARECAARDPGCPAQIDANAMAISVDTASQVQPVLGALRAIFRSLVQLPGPKHVVLVSSGWAMEERAAVSQVTALAEDAARSDTTVHVFTAEEWATAASQSKISPRRVQDQNLVLTSVETLAASTGGRAVRLAGNGEAAFMALSRGLAGYYRLAVKTVQGDLTGPSKRIDLSVARSGLTVSGYRRVVASLDTPAARETTAAASPSPAARPGAGAAASAGTVTEPGRPPAGDPDASGLESTGIDEVGTTEADAALREALRSPTLVSALGVSIGTYVVHGSRPGNLRVVAVAEVTRGVGGPATAGAVLTDGDGRTTTGTERVLMIPSIGPARVMTALPDMPPGTYVLRFAVADREGRIGSVEHPVDALWHDVGGLSTTGVSLFRSSIDNRTFEPVLDVVTDDERLVMQLPLSAPPPQAAGDVLFNVTREGESAPLLRLVAKMGKTGSGGLVAESILPASELQPGRYEVTASLEHASAVVPARAFRLEPADR